ncbi:alpha/beta-hydrolase [Ramaria rubella]|nr:alpha/beta-hydrolase [Ramaria rubella]
MNDCSIDERWDFDATSFGTSCMQQPHTTAPPPPFILAKELTMRSLRQSLSLLVPTGEFSEDCLTINVFSPVVDTNIPIPVLVVHPSLYLSHIVLSELLIIYGGTASYAATSIVTRSVELKQPIIFVSMNYRLGAYGFLGSEEIKKAGATNLGMRDQCLALKWVHKYIGKFGGDPNQFILWGESGRAMCVLMHMLINGGNTEGLFHGAYMQSGTFNPVGDMSIRQDEYNALVQCTGGQLGDGSLEYLKKLPGDKMKAATLNLIWQPRIDGDLFLDTPQNLIRQGKVANIPFINVTRTDARVEGFMRDFCFRGSNNSSVKPVAEAYLKDPAKASPYGTGEQHACTPQFKCLAVFQGDYGFHGPRRFLFNNRSQQAPAWSYLSNKLKSVPYIGSCHATNLPDLFGQCDLQDYLIHFVNGLDPNFGSTLAPWPEYNTNKRQLMTFTDDNSSPFLTSYMFRVEEIALVNKVSEMYPM